MPRRSLVFLLLAVALPAAAQIAESIEVHLLEIEATVVDRGGKPVEGLTAADFDVRVEGKRVPVTNFYLVKRGAIVEEQARAGSQPAPPVPVEFIPTRLVLFVDDVHLHQRTKKRDPSGPDGATYAVDLPGANPNPDIIRENHRNTAVLIARQTGGELIADTNELDLALARVTDQFTTYYSLGVPAPAKGKGLFDIKVSVRNRPELRVVTAPRRSVQSRQEMIASGVRSRLYLRDETNPLEAELRVGAPERKGDRCVADLAMTVNANKLTLITIDDAARGEVSFHFAVIDDRQQESDVRSITTEVRPPVGTPVTQSVSFGLKERKYVVSTAFVDNVSGEASYLQREIDATNCGK